MPDGGSVNQTESSDLTTTSFVPLSGLPSNRSISTVIVPSYSVRVTRRPLCSQVMSRPWRSRVLPLAWFEGLRRSEEHTSELQSQSNLVCRLLLEKKKKDWRSRHAESLLSLRRTSRLLRQS